MKKMLADTCAALCALAASAKRLTPKGFTDDLDVFAVRRGLDTWLKDWSENVRTNAAIETCASFRDKKLRPFLMAQMDPGGKAADDERKVMEKSIDYIWGDGGYRSFGDRKKLVEILDRTAKKPFAAMVRALSDNKGISGPMADWIIDGDFHGEDMRCVDAPQKRRVRRRGSERPREGR